MSVPTRKLSSHKLLLFDVYGTLIETGITAALSPIVPSTWSRKETLLAFDSVECDLRAQHPTLPYNELLARTHEALQGRLNAAGKASPSPPVAPAPSDPQTSAAGSKSTAEDAHRAFAASLRTYPPFPDTVAALQTLKKHFTLATLSNVDRESFAHTQDLLQKPFIYPLTAQDVGAYKPSLDAFNKALEFFEEKRFKKEDILVVAQSLAADHVPARKLGLDAVFIDREGAYTGFNVEDAVKDGVAWRFRTLGEMAKAVEKEIAE